MARALECPACGHRHRIESLPAATTFRCEQCGQVLKAPASVSSQPGAPPPPPRGSAPPARAGAPAPITAPPRRPVTTAPDDGATRDAPVRAAAAVSATVTAAPAATPEVGNGAGRGDRARDREPRARRAPAPRPKSAPRSRVHWYWRLLAWIVAVPVAFLVTAWPAYELGFIKKDDLLDIFVGTGTGRYLRLAIVTLVWAVVTALLVQVLVEGGRVRANRRRRARATA